MQLTVVRQDLYSRGELLLRSFFGAIYIGVPHFFLWIFVGIWSGILGFAAFWAILFTGRYPQSVFEFQIKFFNWHQRVFASMHNLIDGYPAFGLNGTNDKVILAVEYPGGLNRGLVIVRLLFGIFYVTIPHGFCLFFRLIATGIFVFLAWWVVTFYRVLSDYLARIQRGHNAVDAAGEPLQRAIHRRLSSLFRKAVRSAVELQENSRSSIVVPQPTNFRTGKRRRNGRLPHDVCGVGSRFSLSAGRPHRIHHLFLHQQEIFRVHGIPRISGPSYAHSHFRAQCRCRGVGNSPVHGKPPITTSAFLPYSARSRQRGTSLYMAFSIVACVNARKGRFYYFWVFGRFAFAKYYLPGSNRAARCCGTQPSSGGNVKPKTLAQEAMLLVALTIVMRPGRTPP